MLDVVFSSVSRQPFSRAFLLEVVQLNSPMGLQGVKAPAANQVMGTRFMVEMRMLPALSLTEDTSAVFFQISSKGEYLRKP